MQHEVTPTVKDVVYFEYIKKQNESLTNSEVINIIKSSLKWGDEFGVDEKMILAIMTVESKFNYHAISSAGALGLMQIVPKWHLSKIVEARAKLGNPELFDPNTNIFMGTWIYKECLTKFKNKENALLCYNGSNEMPNGYDKKVLIAYNDISGLIKQVK
jgi:soluble lytic murein transglycosylase-like protein